METKTLQQRKLEAQDKIRRLRDISNRTGTVTTPAVTPTAPPPKKASVVPPTFTPVTLTKEHDIIGWDFDQWCDFNKSFTFPCIVGVRKFEADSETMSAIYKAIAHNMQRYLVEGAVGMWSGQADFISVVKDISSKAINCERLYTKQLFPFLRAAVQCFSDESDLSEMFGEMKAAEIAGKELTVQRMEFWIEAMLPEVAAFSMNLTQQSLYNTLMLYWTRLSNCSGVVIDGLEYIVMAYKYGASKCTEENTRRLELQGLAKCFGGIDPVEYRWIEPLGRFRSRAWAILEHYRVEVESLVSESKRMEADAAVVRAKAASMPTEPPFVAPVTHQEIWTAVAKQTTPPENASVPMATNSVDQDELDRLSYCTDIDILMAVLNNRKTRWEACDRIAQDPRVFALLRAQADDRIPTTQPVVTHMSR